MRRLFGSAPVVLARRWLALSRLSTVVLYRDQFRDPPGPSLALALGERTTYRPATWVLDLFDREDGPLGAPWVGLTVPDYHDLMIEGGRVVPVASAGAGSGGLDFVAMYDKDTPRDQWAALTIGALAAPAEYASVGLALRLTADGDGYFVWLWRDSSGASGTSVYRYSATLGDGSLIDDASVVWHPGDVVRFTAEWNRLRVYRGPACIVDVIDPTPILASGRIAIEAYRQLDGDVAAVASAAGGPLRQEYRGAVLDMGDVQHALGQPVAFDVTVSNLAPMGGKPRFAALLRHGLNTDDTFDLDRGLIRVYSAIQDVEAPIMVAEGLIDNPGDVAEDRVKLVARGRDAFLTPKIDPGTVVYLAGPPPVAAPIPDDPCAKSPDPVVDAGAPPEEPPAIDAPVGVGPEQPPTEPTPLLGAYLIVIGYRQGDLSLVPPEPPWVYRTEVIPLPSNVLVATGCGGDELIPANPDGSCPDGWTHKPDGNCHRPTRIATFFPWDATGTDGPLAANIGAGTFYGYLRHQPSPYQWNRVMTLLYRGPDVIGTGLVADITCPAIPGGTFGVDYTEARMQAFGQRFLDVAWAGSSWDTQTIVNLKLARYDATKIYSVADLEALRLASPGDGAWDLFLPRRIETLLSTSVTVTSTKPTDWLEHDGPLSTGPTIPVNQFTGPTLLALELINEGLAGPVWGGAGGQDALTVCLVAEYLRPPPAKYWPPSDTRRCARDYILWTGAGDAYHRPGACEYDPHSYEYAQWWYCYHEPAIGMPWGGPTEMSVKKAEDPWDAFYRYGHYSPPDPSSGYWPFNLIIKSWLEPGHPPITNPAPSCGDPGTGTPTGPPWPHGATPPPEDDYPYPTIPYPEKPERYAIGPPSLGT